MEEGSFAIGLFLLTLLGGICRPVGTNLINTYGDYRSGVDTIESAVTCPQLVLGLLTLRSMKRAGIAAFLLASVFGLMLTYFCGWPVFAIGIISVVAGYCYTAGFYPYKYKGLGSIFVLFLMGPVMVWSAYYIQTGKYSLIPILVSLPIGLLVAGILLGNDIRDFAHDRQAGIKTLALTIGFQKSMILYYTLYVSAYMCLIVLSLTDILPWTALLPLLLLPVALKMFRQVYNAVEGSYDKIKLLEAKSQAFTFNLAYY